MSRTTDTTDMSIASPRSRTVPFLTALILAALVPVAAASAGEVATHIDTLAADDWEDRAAAAEALGEHAERDEADLRDAIEPLVEALGDPFNPVGKAASDALARIGSEAAAPLIEAMSDDRPYVRWHAATTLGRIEPVEDGVVPTLVEALSDRHERVRQRSAEALERIGSDEAVDELEPLIEAEDVALRSRALEVIGRIGEQSERVPEALAGALALEDDAVRHWAGEALADMGEAAAPAESTLRNALMDDRQTVRASAIAALAEIGLADELRHEILDAATDEEAVRTVRASAMDALADVELDADDIPALITVMKQPGAAAYTAAGHLARIGSESVPALIEVLEAGDDGAGRAPAISALTQLGDAADPAIPLLIEIMQDASASSMRSVAARALGTLEAEEAIDDLIEAMKHDHWFEVRADAAAGLARMGPLAEPALPAMEEAAEEDPYVSEEISEALEDLRDQLED